MSEKLVIMSKNEMDDDTWSELYWSREWGWTTMEEADKFTEEEAASLTLPIGGEWIYQISQGGDSEQQRSS